MAPEQGPDSKSKAEKTQELASDEESVLASDTNKNDSLNKDGVGWIYLLRKEQLVDQCRSVGIPTTGYTVEFLRRKLAEALRTRRLRASAENLLREVEDEVRQSESSIIQDEPVAIPVPSAKARLVVPDADIMCTVQKWNLRYSGESDLMEFLERIEELAECYQIHTDQLLPTMLAVLNGNALKWYRVKRAEIRSWADFRNEIQKFFLPKRFLSQIEQNFYNRRQNTRERAKDFILSMLTLARQHPDLRNRDHLDRIYDGLRSEYRHYVRRGDFSSLDELISMTDEFEALKREERPQPTHMITATGYDRKKVCGRRKRKGHRRDSCTFKRRLFCSDCGRDGTFSISCDCRDSRIETPAEGDSRYYIVITINGLKVHALIDTGSSKTHINKRVANHLIASGVPCIESHEVAQMVDRSLVNLSRRFKVSVSFMQNSTTLCVSEMPKLAEDVILGMDFLASHKIEIRLGGTVVPSTNTDQTSFLYSHTSRQILASKKNDRIRECSKHQTERLNRTAKTMIGQSTRKDHRHRDQQPSEVVFAINTKTANPRKYCPPPLEKPVAYRPPSEARPKKEQQNPPPLPYRKTIPRKVRLPKYSGPSTVTAPGKPKAPSLNTTISKAPVATIQNIKSSESLPPTSKAVRNPAAGKLTTDALLEGITVRRPKTYKRHLQYMIQRPRLPPVQVTVLNQAFARIRCQGHRKVVRMIETGEKQ